MSHQPPLDYTANCLKAFDDGHLATGAVKDGDVKSPDPLVDAEGRAGRLLQGDRAMDWVKCTKDGKPVFINLAFASQIEPIEKGSKVYLTSGPPALVDESPQQILDMMRPDPLRREPGL